MLSGQWVTHGHVSTQSHRAIHRSYGHPGSQMHLIGSLGLSRPPFCLCVLGEHTQTHTHHGWNTSLSIPFPTGA